MPPATASRLSFLPVCGHHVDCCLDLPHQPWARASTSGPSLPWSRSDSDNRNSAVINRLRRLSHGSFRSRLREQRQRGRATTRQLNVLKFYFQSAILLFLISESHAAGTPEMFGESSAWWELLELPHECLPRYENDAKA